MLKFRGFASLCGVCLFAVIIATVSNEQNASSVVHLNKVLVLIDNVDYKSSHSTYFKTLKALGYQLDIRMSDAVDLTLVQFKEFIYDHIIMLGSRTEEFGGQVNPKLLTKFIDSGRSILVMLGDINGLAVRQFLSECGWKIQREALNDRAEAQEQDLKFNRDNIIQVAEITGGADNVELSSKINIPYEPNNPYMTPILALPDLSKSSASINDKSFLYYAMVMQSKNNARVTLISTADLFTNERMNDEHNQNDLFARSVSKWTFQRSGHLRIKTVRHHLVNETDQKAFYTIRQHLHFEIEIEKLNADGQWKGFCLDQMQLEFVRIDPFVRQNLKCNDGGIHWVEFQIPDVHGVYKLYIDHAQPGYSRISLSQLLPIHPLRHDQYERFIPQAYPYYLTCLSMAIGAFLLTVVIIHHEDKRSSKVEATRTAVVNPSKKLN